MTHDLKGMTAAVTGASAGIGRALAGAFADEGLAVVLAARRHERLKQIVDEITARGGRALPLVADVTREEDARALVDAALSAFGRLDVMVCNAGFGFYGTADQTESTVMQRLMDVNFMGTFHAVRAVMPVFRRQNSGHLFVISSIVGRRGIPYMGGYCATKFAQVGLAEAVRAECVGTQVKVTVVYPVSTRTEFLETVRRDYGHVVSGHGPQQNAETVARSIIRCLKRPRPEIYPLGFSRVLTVFNALAPGLCDRFVQRYKRNED